MIQHRCRSMRGGGGLANVAGACGLKPSPFIMGRLWRLRDIAHDRSLRCEATLLQLRQRFQKPPGFVFARLGGNKGVKILEAAAIAAKQEGFRLNGKGRVVAA